MLLFRISSLCVRIIIVVYTNFNDLIVHSFLFTFWLYFVQFLCLCETLPAYSKHVKIDGRPIEEQITPVITSRHCSLIVQHFNQM